MVVIVHFFASFRLLADRLLILLDRRMLVSANFKAAQKPEFTPFFSSSQLKRSFQPTVCFKAIVYGGEDG
jgi:hypothetical protein